MQPIPKPVVTPRSAPFWDGLRRGVVMAQYSPSSDAYVFYPRLLAPGTLVDDLEWREIDGHGALYTFSVSHRPVAPPWAERSTPLVLAIVEWDVGPRISAELVCEDATELSVGDRVVPHIVDHPSREFALLKYRRA